MNNYEYALLLVKQVENINLDLLNEKKGKFETVKHIPVFDKIEERKKYVIKNFPTFDKEINMAYDYILYNSSKGMDWSFFKLFAILLASSFIFFAGYQINNITSPSITTTTKTPTQIMERPAIEHPQVPVQPPVIINERSSR